MNKNVSFRAGGFCLVILLVSSLGQVAVGQTALPSADSILRSIQGGLVVQLGADDTATPAALGRTRRYLVNILDTDRGAVERAREQFRAQGQYGLVSAEHIPASLHLPYTENLVNLVIVRNFAVPAAEILRVLAPEGAVLVCGLKTLTKEQLKNAGFDRISDTRTVGGMPAFVARKPWPKDMDTWSHPRHAADGNAASKDTVVGVPDRVRWIAAATQEIEGLVTAGGRNFYGGILARDSFNGLRLWHRDLGKENLNVSPFSLPRLLATQARPVASRDYLFAISRGKPVALDAITGGVAREFPRITRPRHLANCGDLLVASDENAVRAFNVKTGQELWSFAFDRADCLVAGYGTVSFVQNRPKSGEEAEAVALDLQSGKVKWRRSDYSWLRNVTRMVLHQDQLAFEVSSMSDHDHGNALHVVSAKTGDALWEKTYPPGMNHRRQARAMFLDSGLWILHGGKTNTVDKDHTFRLPLQVSALDPRTGETKVTHEAGLTHCFPPVATPRFIFTGVMDMTDVQSGKMVANPITKAHCSQENGWVPANGLVYTTPKHCTCWPILRGFVALAARAPTESPAHKPLNQIQFALEKGPARPDSRAPNPQPADWPLYRHDQWRSGSTTFPGPKSLKRIWSVRLASELDVAIAGDAPIGPILHDWRENPIVKGPVSAPVIANGLAYITRPNAHEVIAIDTASGKVRWRFTANGRVDTPPAIHRGLCLFGSQAGSVYALRADTGEMVWRLQAAPTNERIVAYGQVESPWPVPGAVLISNDIAYFAAGRQPFADGGVFIFAIDPMTGHRHWIHRLNTIPQTGYYENSGLEFDPFDILHVEGDGITMSRWIFSRDGQSVQVDKWDAFARINTGKGAAYVPRGFWTYGPRHQHRFPGEASRRPLCAFRDRAVFSSLDGTTKLFRRDFNLENGEEFKTKWITGWEAANVARTGGTPYRNYRLAEKATWTTDPFSLQEKKAGAKSKGAQLYNDLHALALSGDGRLFVVHKDGRLKSISVEDGRMLAETQVPPPAWDALAIANNRLFLTTQTGELHCLGD